MIQTKKDLKRYMEMDKIALGIKKKHPSILGDEIWKFERVLRKHEYYKNCTTNIIALKFYSVLHRKIGIKLGFSIPCNIFGGGLELITTDKL